MIFALPNNSLSVTRSTVKRINGVIAIALKGVLQDIRVFDFDIPRMIIAHDIK